MSKNYKYKTTDFNIDFNNNRDIKVNKGLIDLTSEKDKDINQGIIESIKQKDKTFTLPEPSNKDSVITSVFIKSDKIAFYTELNNKTKVKKVFLLERTKPADYKQSLIDLFKIEPDNIVIINSENKNTVKYYTVEQVKGLLS